MVWWIVLAAVLLGLLVLALALAPFPARLRALERAQRRLARTLAAAEALPAKAAPIQARIESLPIPGGNRTPAPVQDTAPPSLWRTGR